MEKITVVRLTNQKKDCWCPNIGYYSSWDELYHTSTHQEIEVVKVVGMSVTSSADVWYHMSSENHNQFGIYDSKNNRIFDVSIDDTSVLISSKVTGNEYNYIIDNQRVIVLK